MTNYNERLDEVLEQLHEHGNRCYCDTEDDSREYSAAQAKQAIISLIKELVAEAKPAKAIIADDEMGIDRARKSAANSTIDQFEQNLLEALEEV